MTTAKPTVARVEVLRAEVRVLMVGSRQVTMSVFNQLDWCPVRDLDPMGRVSSKDGPALIGCDPSGNLVRAHLPFLSQHLDYLCAKQEVGQVTGEVYNTSSYRDGLAHTLRFRYDGFTFSVGWTEYHLSADDPPTSNSLKDHWQDRVAKHYAQYHLSQEALDDLVAEHRRVATWRKECEALPLIVLAGLR